MIRAAVRRAWRRHFPIDRRAECGSWRRGQLAVCVLDRWWSPDPSNPKKGDILRVSFVYEASDDGERVIFLQFDGKPKTVSWEARGFRKPVQGELAPADADFIATIAPTRAPLLPARQPEHAA